MLTLLVAIANFYTCNPNFHFWILQNAQLFLDSGATGNRLYRKYFFSNSTHACVACRYGKFSLIVTHIAISEYYKTHSGFSDAVKKIFLKSILLTFNLCLCCSLLLRISIIVTRIAISEYYKTHNCFLDSGGNRNQAVIFFRKKYIFQFSLQPASWQPPESQNPL